MAYLDQVLLIHIFIQQGRFGRLAEAVARFSKPILVSDWLKIPDWSLRKGNDCEVIGTSMVVCFDPRNLNHNRYIDLEPGTPCH